MSDRESSNTSDYEPSEFSEPSELSDISDIDEHSDYEPDVTVPSARPKRRLKRTPWITPIRRRRRVPPRKQSRLLPPPPLKFIQVKPVSTLDELITLGESYDKTAKYSVDGVELVAKAVPSLKKLQNMYGLETIKSTITKQILYKIQKLSSEDDFMHCVVYGDRGTGKTSVIKIIGEIFASIGFLSTGKVHSVTRADLIAEYVGQTAPKTTAAVTSAFGGVLLIDEFYSLGDQTDESYDKECLDTLNQLLSEHRDKFICIVAGYPEDINEKIWPLNKGLKRRFPWVYTIAPYTNDQLIQILDLQLDRIGWKLDPDARATLKHSLDTGDITMMNFGGDTETLITKCKIAYATRMFGMAHTYTISNDDMVIAIAQFKEMSGVDSDDVKFQNELRWRLYT